MSKTFEEWWTENGGAYKTPFNAARDAWFGAAQMYATSSSGAVQSGLDLAIEHLNAQRLIWNQGATIYPSQLIAMLVKNLEALKYSTDKSQSNTPRTDALVKSVYWDIDAQQMVGIDDDDQYVLAEFARQLERELAEADEALKRWYSAASPYAIPEALKEALAIMAKMQQAKQKVV